MHVVAPAVSTVPAGSYWNGTAVLPCPEDTYADSVRSVAEGGLASCTACSTGRVTRGQTGQNSSAACGACFVV